MEIRKTLILIKKATVAFFAIGFVMLLLPIQSLAQETIKVYTVKNGKMYIELSKKINETDLDGFITTYDLSDLALKYFIKTGIKDSLHMQGWEVIKNNENVFAISKPIDSPEDLTNLAEKNIFAAQLPDITGLFPSINNGLLYGFNRFKNKSTFFIKDSIVSFYLRNNTNATRVTLAGNFNNWDPDSMPMTKTDSGFICPVKLGPGKYWYKFIVDGNWMIDEDNLQKENDGRGNTNSVYFKTNYIFKLNDYLKAKKVNLSGSFNNWKPKELLMQRADTGWVLPLYLAAGTHTYKFVVDGNWKTDPENSERFPNEFNDFNSVIYLGKPYLFRLNGFSDANKVLLTGNFNRWRKDELFMKKTDSGWILPYSLGPGNYEYRFIVDGKEIIDPGNPVFTNSDLKIANSLFIIEPNFTFCLKGFPDAKQIFLAGDFNNFKPNSFLMKKTGSEWIYTVHLTPGKHIYKFIVDGQWIRDPENKLWEDNKYGTGDSVIWFGE